MSARVPSHGDQRRGVVLISLVVVLVALGIVATTTSSAFEPLVATSIDRASLSAESSAFYCGGLEHVAGTVESYVAVADLSSAPRIVEITTTNERQQAALRQVKILPGHVFHFTPARLLNGSFEAASVDANEGGIAVTESIRGVNGMAVAPCVSSAAPDWWTTGGSTEPGEGYVLTMFNPSASDAVVSVTLYTPKGIVTPSSYQSIFLGPHQLSVLGVHAVAPNESPITANVVATSGSVVVYAIQRSTTSAQTVSLLPASPNAPTSSYLPVGTGSSNATTQLLLVDTGAGSVTASVHVLLSAGCSTRCAAPFLVDLSPDVVTALRISPSSRVPSGSSFAMSVLATAPGVITVERVSADAETGQSAPVDDPSLVGATHLVLVNPFANGFDAVDVLNPSGTSVRVSLGTVGPSGFHSFGLTYRVAANGTLPLSSGALRGVIGGVLELRSTGPVVASGVVHDALIGSSVLVAVPT